MRYKPVMAVLLLVSVLWMFPFSASAADYSVFKERPRLYFTKARLEQLRSFKNEKPYSDFLRIIRKRARAMVGNRVPNNLLRYNNESVRRPADGLVDNAFYYLITGDSSSFIAVQNLLRTFCSAQVWGNNEDIGAAHGLFALSLAYDWFYDELSSAMRLMIKDSIVEHAEILHEILVSKRLWWAQSRGQLQNHNYVNTGALAVAGIALYGEDRRALKWLKTAEKNFNEVLGLLSPDGASHEGVAYWSYGTLWLLNYYMAMEPAQGLGMVRSNSFLKNTAKFRLYASLPGFRYNVDFADSPMVDYYGPGTMLRCLAGIFNDGHAQWLADEIERKKRMSSVLWQDYIWYDPEVQPQDPQNLPLHAWFDNLGILLTRSSWKDDASLILFKCGPPQGFHAQSKGVYPGSHIHPDAGHFGVWLGKRSLVHDDGYPLKKLTVNHNTLTFNKLGQTGEGETFFRAFVYKKERGAMPRPRYVSGKGFQAVEVELAGFYPASARPKSWKRTVVVINGEDIFIKDRVIPGGTIQITYPLHLYRKARMVNGKVCIDNDSGYVLNFEGNGFSTGMKRYSSLLWFMAKKIPRSGMLYQAQRKTASPSTMFTAVGRSAEGCSNPSLLLKSGPDSDLVLVEGRSGRFMIDFSKLEVRKL
ncbi:heparinase II/III domain-containing protein [Maridesulfovibrio sp.]|uniref:heparinase II/III domain-containing protein n=1 Tax=Maridesulfovibrio sp. TaxID=2795000 RepID=UPI003BA942E9